MFPNSAPYPLNIPQPVNVFGGIASNTPASTPDELPNKQQLDNAVSALNAAISAKPSTATVENLIAVAVSNAELAIDVKPSCKAAATANVNLSLEADLAYDDVSIDLGDRVLLAFQATANQNGTYEVYYDDIFSINKLRRTDDQFTTRATVEIEQGTAYAGRKFQLTTNDPIVLGTTPLTWVLVPNTGAPAAGDDSIEVVGNAVSVRLEGQATTEWPIELDTGGLRGNGLYMAAAARKAGIEDIGLAAGVDVTNQNLANLTGAQPPLDNGLTNAGTPIRILTGQTNPSENGAYEAVLGGAVNRFGLFLVLSSMTVWACGLPGVAPIKIYDPLAPTAKRYITPFAFGDGTATVFTITHNLNSIDVVCALRDTINPGANWLPNITARTYNTIELTFAIAPATGQFFAVVVG